MYLERINICPARDSGSLFILYKASMHLSTPKQGTGGRDVKTEIFLRTAITWEW